MLGFLVQIFHGRRQRHSERLVRTRVCDCVPRAAPTHIHWLGSVFEKNGAQVVVDDVSMEFVDGATVDFVVEMVSESFQVVGNPNADGGCGCGVSFSAK